jgi:hypothetical protein
MMMARAVTGTTCSRWLEKEEEYRASAKLQGSDRRSTGLKRTLVCSYLEMIYHLAFHISYLCNHEISVELWMLAFEGQRILYLLRSDVYLCPSLGINNDDPDQYQIKFSNTWQRNFMRRKIFSF